MFVEKSASSCQGPVTKLVARLALTKVADLGVHTSGQNDCTGTMRRPKESGQIRAKRVLDADVTTPMKRKRNGQIIPSEKCATEITCSIPSFQTVDEALQFSYESFPSMSFNPPLRPILVKSQIYAVVANRNYVDSQLMRMQNDGKIRMLKLEDETDETLAIMRSEDYAASFQDVNVLDIDDTTVF
ncbi:uncharacterized protein DEA37_0005351, partial [Paragonimus westermani]